VNEEVRALVEYRLGQADECLESAQILLERGKCRGAVNRSYYAMFYGVLALLAIRGRETSKHIGAISLFDRDFVKAGLLDPELSSWLHETFYLRQEADYRPMVEVSPERAGAALERARAFVAAAKAQIDKMIVSNDRTT
jgi:uncharacterized protein (UPF0332 family)